MEKIRYMFQGGIAMVYQYNGKLKSNIKKIKKIKTRFQLLNLEKNVENLLTNGLKFINSSLKGWGALEIGKIITQQ